MRIFVDSFDSNDSLTLLWNFDKPAVFGDEEKRVSILKKNNARVPYKRRRLAFLDSQKRSMEISLESRNGEMS